MSDLLTRLAERALGRAAPALEPRLPSRWADAPPRDDAAAFSEHSVETEAPPHRSAPRARIDAGRDDSAPPRRTAAPDAPPPRLSPSPSAPAPVVAEARPSAEAPARQPAPATRVDVAGEDRPRPGAPRDERVHGEPVSVRPPVQAAPAADAGDGFRVVETLVERPSPAPARAAGARQGHGGPPADRSPERRETGGDPSPAPSVAERGAEVVREIVREVPAARREEAAPVTETKAKGAGDGVREVVTRVERAAPSAAVAGAPSAAGREAEAREGGEERPVIRVTIGRIEVRAAPQTPTPQPSARKGWKPPVMGLDAYLKREGGR